MPKSRPSSRRPNHKKLSFESLEPRALLSLPPAAPDPNVVATPAEVDQLLRRAAAASRRSDAIIAVVDRNGTILGVQVESGVPISDPATLDFAIDGAVSEARTAAFFSNNGGPGTALTSRTIRQISQSTVTQREVQSNPNITDVTSTQRGPGFVAPIGLGGHFPPDVAHTPPVDLFAIEHTNRDSLFAPGPDHIEGTADDIALPNRFNIPSADIPAGVTIPVPLSYNEQAQVLFDPTIGRYFGQSRGIGTLPGGIPLYKSYKPTPTSPSKLALVGGIGVFFPGTTGYADFEQNFHGDPKQTTAQRTNAPLALLAEWMAFAAAGGSAGVGAGVGKLPTSNGAAIAPVPGYTVPLSSTMKIFLAGISLDQVGQGSKGGVNQTLAVGRGAGHGVFIASGMGSNQQVMPGGITELTGAPVSTGILVTPHTEPGDTLTPDDVTKIIQQGINTANQTRAQIRLPAGRVATRMVFAVSDQDGNVLGLYRMADATIFSIDVAVAKSRNVTYYASADIQPFDQVHVNDPSLSSPTLPVGTAFTNRTFRFLAEPRYPAGVDGSIPGAFSILRENWVNRFTAYNNGPPAPADDINTVLGYDSFFPGTNFHDPNNLANQNGVVFFPGSSPLYASQALVGGFGVSGDGVDQDDVVTFFGAQGFAAPTGIRADQFFVRGVRLPYQKFSRNAFQL